MHVLKMFFIKLSLSLSFGPDSMFDSFEINCTLQVQNMINKKQQKTRPLTQRGNEGQKRWSASGSPTSSSPSFSFPQIMELVKGMHYQLACQKYFELTHNVRTPFVLTRLN